MLTRIHVLRAVAAAVAVFTLTSAMAQSYLDAGSKMRGDFGWSSRSGGRSMNSARDYSRDYRQYARSVPAVTPEVAREASDTIGNYITKAQKHMAWMRKQAQAAGDKETLASLDVIDKNLADSAKEHQAMHEMCMKDNPDAAGSMKCCQQIDESLSAAIAEHDKLMKRLGLATPAGATK